MLLSLDMGLEHAMVVLLEVRGLAACVAQVGRAGVHDVAGRVRCTHRISETSHRPVGDTLA